MLFGEDGGIPVIILGSLRAFLGFEGWIGIVKGIILVGSSVLEPEEL